MAKLYLKFDQQLLKEVTLEPGTLTIGRLPDNMLQIDNLAVSGHHAKVTGEGNQYVIEDLGSLNGTYVNNQRVGKATLNDGDQVLIGKHVVQFRNDQPQAAAPPAPKPGPATAKLDATVVLDTKKSQEMLAGMNRPDAVRADGQDDYDRQIAHGLHSSQGIFCAQHRGADQPTR